MSVYFTGDQHYFHNNILLYDNGFNNTDELKKEFYTENHYSENLYDVSREEALRYFTDSDRFYRSDRRILRPYSTVEEMNEDMIQKWNSVVSPGDTVYHVGDIFFTSTKTQAREIRARLNGNISICWGNHDQVAKDLKDLWEWCGDVREIKVEDSDCEEGFRRIFLSHYAHRTWNKSHHGTFHLFGHSHLTLSDDPNSLSFDVGCMGNGMKPYSYEQVKERMSKKTFKPIDHHGVSNR